MTHEELIARLRQDDTDFWHCEAADRIDALVKEQNYWVERCGRERAFASSHRVRAERLEAALREIAAEASVPVRTKKKGGIKHKWMYRGWRKIAVERIDIARAALKGADHE